MKLDVHRTLSTLQHPEPLVEDPINEPQTGRPIAEQPAQRAVREADVPLVPIPVRAGSIPPRAGRAPRARALLHRAAGHSATIDRDVDGTSTLDANAHGNRR